MAKGKIVVTLKPEKVSIPSHFLELAPFYPQGTTMNEKEAFAEAARLNRVHANAYRRYVYALRKQPKIVTVGRVLQEGVINKDHRNKVIDELHALAHYTYISKSGYETQIRKYNTARAIKTALEVEVQARRVDHTAPTPLLTRELLSTHLYYDPIEGSFEWQTGTQAGKVAGSITKLAESPPPKQHKSDKTKLARKPIPPAGYVAVSKETYFNYVAGNSASNGEPVYERFYATSPPTTATATAAATADQLVRTPYYLRRAPQKVLITIMGKKYTAQQIAYLYMGAGGDWSYSKGLAKAYRVHTDVAPEGLRLYCHKTNKPKRIPCRDGDALNCKWENIEPYRVYTAEIVVDPTAADTRTRQITRRVVRLSNHVSKVGYNWVVHGLGNTPFFGTEMQAMAEFDRLVGKMRGTKQRLRNGDMMVSREQLST